MVEKFVDRTEIMREAHGVEAAAAEADDIEKRQTNWLKRGRAAPKAKSKSAAWKPRKLHRVAARKWMLHLDNAVALFGLHQCKNK